MANKIRVRPAYVGAHFAMSWIVAMTLFLYEGSEQLIPATIWLATTAVIVIFGKEE